jgi:hypothetical protein
MLRTIKIGAIVALANVIGAQSAGAQTLTWGIFRENATDVSESLRNCWTQAMVSGQTINGELMAQNLTERQAEFQLQKFARLGTCAAERSSQNWSARGEGHDHSWQAGNNGSYSGGYHGDWSGSNGSDASN